ncbi:MAG: N-acetylmuramoyl-L-alanine amidase [Clostridia bacterium]|nr:N-acetylmuramoyl-L-alanine amidase [Clostridia bacterium]
MEPAPLPAEPEPAPVDPEPAPVDPEPLPAEPEPAPAGNSFCVAIDPGHQRKGNSNPEPIGPGASQTKAKVASGTTGRFSGLNEYELTLAVSLLLRDELEARGYQVVMTRTDHDVDLSNAQRAQIAADAGADAFIRIHANGSEDPAVEGALTICMTKNSPYCPQLYDESRRLSELVLDGLTAATGAKKRSVWETDTMSGVNWASMPVTIVEMGFMTNEKEDLLMASADYQQKLACGMADGIDAYFAALN